MNYPDRSRLKKHPDKGNHADKDKVSVHEAFEKEGFHGGLFSEQEQIKKAEQVAQDEPVTQAWDEPCNAEEQQENGKESHDAHTQADRLFLSNQDRKGLPTHDTVPLDVEEIELG
jgi:hypothetical protein